MVPRQRRRKICSTDRKSTRLNSSHLGISYAVFCLKKKNHLDTGPDGRNYLAMSGTDVSLSLEAPQLFDRQSTCVARFPPFLFFFNDTATTEIYTLSLHDALPI